MVLKKCPQCGNQFTPEGDRCPNCGAPIPIVFFSFAGKLFRLLKWTGIVIGTLFVLMVVIAILSQSTKVDSVKQETTVAGNNATVTTTTNPPPVAVPAPQVDTKPKEPPKQKTGAKPDEQPPPPQKAQGKSKERTAAEDAGLKLLAMQQKGYIDLFFTEMMMTLSVEPLAWKGMTHKDKGDLCQLALDFASGINKDQRKRIAFLSVKNMTTREELAKGYVRDGKIEIFK